MPMDYAKVADRFKQTGLTLEAAGVRYGFPPATARQQFSNLIKGRRANPTIETVEKLCEIFECSIFDLLTETSAARGPTGGRRR